MRYSTKQVKDSALFTIFVGGSLRWRVRHNSLGDLEGVRANLPLLRGGYCAIFLLFSPPPPLLIIFAQSLTPEVRRVIPYMGV